MLNSRYAGIVLQHAHKMYLVRLVRRMSINSAFPKFRENIIRAICADLKGEVRRLDRLGRLSRGIQAGMLIEIIQDIEDVLLDSMLELLSDYDFVSMEDL